MAYYFMMLSSMCGRRRLKTFWLLLGGSLNAFWFGAPNRRVQTIPFFEFIMAVANSTVGALSRTRSKNSMWDAPFRGSCIYCKEHAAVQGLQSVYRGLTATKRKESETCMAGRTLEFWDKSLGSQVYMVGGPSITPNHSMLFMGTPKMYAYF